jgi:hypothetical protein
LWRTCYFTSDPIKAPRPFVHLIGTLVMKYGLGATLTRTREILVRFASTPILMRP